MATIGQSSWAAVVNWEHLPEGYVHRDGSDVAVDSHDRVYLLTRSDARVIVYERTGEFVTAWGEDTLSADPHGITIGPDDIVYCVDRGAHVVQAFSRDGVPKAVIGKSGVPSDTGFDSSIRNPLEREARMRSGPPFNRPTKAAIGPNGDVFVSDGYGNARIHHFSADGTLLNSWGGPGGKPGQFRVPHCLAITPDLRLLVADRENSRVQIFTLSGALLDIWIHLQRPESIALDSKGFIYVGEAPDGPPNPSTRYQGADRLPGRLSILDSSGTVLERIEGGRFDDCVPGNFISISGMTIDSQGDVYITQNAEAARRSMGLTYDPNCPVIQKLTRR